MFIKQLTKEQIIINVIGKIKKFSKEIYRNF